MLWLFNQCRINAHAHVANGEDFKCFLTAQENEN